MTEIVADEWLVEYLSPASEAEKVEIAHVFTWIVKSRCDKMIFTPEHFRRFQSKVDHFKKEMVNRFYFPLVLRPLTLLLFNSDKVEKRAGVLGPEMEKLPEDDLPVVQSVVSTNSKLLVTTDERLVDILSKNFVKYGIECVDPEVFIATI